MNFLARILSHGFAVVLVLLLGAGFIYRGELFPDMPMPEFLGLDKRDAVEPEAAATPGTTETVAEAGSTTTTEAPADAVLPAQADTDTGGAEAPVESVDKADTAATDAEAAEELPVADAPEAVTEPATATPVTPLPETPVPEAETEIPAPDTTVTAAEPLPDESVTEAASAPADAADTIAETAAETATDSVVPAGVTTPPGEAPAAEPAASEALEPEPAAVEAEAASVTSVPGMTAEPAPPAMAADEVAPAVEAMPPETVAEPPAPPVEVKAEPEPAASTPVTDSEQTAPASEGQPDTVAIPAPDTEAEAPAMEAVAEPAVAATLDMTRPYHVLAAAREAYWLHNHEQAESLYRRLIDLEPENPDGYGELGNLYFSQGKWDDAASAYFEAGSRLARTGHTIQAQNLLEVIRGLNGSQADELAAIIDESR
jgi:hypothetical protein